MKKFIDLDGKKFIDLGGLKYFWERLKTSMPIFIMNGSGNKVLSDNGEYIGISDGLKVENKNIVINASSDIEFDKDGKMIISTTALSKTTKYVKLGAHLKYSEVDDIIYVDIDWQKVANV